MKMPIDATWLAEIGFRWSQFDRQPDKHWTLWLGWAMEEGPCVQDVGLEVAPGYDGKWFCWLRSDTAHRYSRFVHIRHIRTQDELIALISAIAGRPFDPANVYYGNLLTPARAARQRLEDERLDRRLDKKTRWSTDLSEDPTLAGARTEHLVDFEKRRGTGQ